MARTRKGHVAGWTLIVTVLAAACSAVPDRITGASSSGTGASGHGGASAASAGGSAGGGLGGSLGMGGGIVIDAGPMEAGPPPPTCDATCAAAGGTCKMGFCTLTDNPGNVDPGTKASLQGGGNADPAFAWLYPYDKTVFPRGILSPSLQFAGTDPSAAYVHISSTSFDYKGWYGPSSPARVQLTPAMWQAVTAAAKAKDVVKVEVTKMAGGQVTGPITETWTIAQGSVRGTIYYETYGSPILGGSTSVGIMKIAPGAAQPTPFKSGCANVCHTASADGSTLVSATGQSGLPPWGTYSASYDLKNNGSTILSVQSGQFTYGGIYPDGSFVVSATGYRLWLAFPYAQPSRLYDTKTGMQIPAPTWDTDYAGTTAFSPDGKFIAFNLNSTTGGAHDLAMMSFDKPTFTFANKQTIASDPAHTLGWPAFTPDSKWVLFHSGSSNEYETDSNNTGDLFITDATTHVVTRLDSLDGYSYLPANDPGLSFAPTVLPEAVGGYFWCLFTSHRSYGNTLPSKANNDQNGKLWAAAIDLNPTDGVDPSHPAFYLDGQEAAADNLRGFWVLDPCKADGTSCTSGDQCCGGYCNLGGDGGPAVCSAVMMGCSAEFDKCTTAADCCNATDLCINGHCSTPAPK
jgi:hypothetical protein